jgi:hypothetical protein
MAPQLCKVNPENVWRLRLEEAAKRHKLAKAEFSKLLQQCTNGIHPDRSTMTKASMEADAAREEHLRVLEIFTNFVIRHTPPPEE